MESLVPPPLYHCTLKSRDQNNVTNLKTVIILTHSFLEFGNYYSALLYPYCPLNCGFRFTYYNTLRCRLLLTSIAYVILHYIILHFVN